MSSEWFCRWGDRERQALSGVSPMAKAMYMVLRFQMDFTTGLVGVRTPISWPGLAWELRTETPRGKGCQITRPTLQVMRSAVDGLIRAGLLKEHGGKELLSFLCPLAKLASVRPFYTQHSGNRPQSTEHNRIKASRGADLDGIGNMPFCGVDTSNPTHISEVVITTPPQSSSTDSIGGDACAGEGPDRDRPAGSQAGSLGRPGKPHEEPNRDRPAASHPAPGRRLNGAALPGEAPIQVVHGETGECSAESESTAAAVGAPDGERIAALTRALERRSIRVPADGAVLADWAARGVTPLELDGAIDKALEVRTKEGSLQPVGVAYVGSIIHSKRAAVKRTAEAARKAVAMGPARARDGDLESLAKSVGMWPARMGELTPAFRARVLAAVQEQMEAGRHG